MHFFPLGIRDTTASTLGGFSRRTVVYGNSIYTVTNVDGSTFFSIHKADHDAETVTTYGSSGNATAVGSTLVQHNIAACLFGSTMHIVYLANPSGTKKIYHTSFDVSTDAWSGVTTEMGTGGVTPLAKDSLDMVAGADGVIHLVTRANTTGTTWVANYWTRSTAGTWSSATQIESTTLSSGPAYVPCLDVDDGGRVLVMLDDGTGGLATQSQWKAWELSAGVFTGTVIKGLGQASMCHTSGNVRHILFFGDKRHTVVKSNIANLTTTLGAIQFEQPYVEGGIVGGTNYGYAFSCAADGNDIHIATAAHGQVFQASYRHDHWEPLRTTFNATGNNIHSGRTQKIACDLAREFLSDGSLGIAVKQDDLSAKNWFVLHRDTGIPARGGITHSLTIDGEGFMVSGPLQKADISQAVPRVSLATELKTEDTLSDLSSVTQTSWHHGRGERILSNPNAFLDQEGLLTHIPDQITQQLFPVSTDVAAASVGPVLLDAVIINSTSDSGNAVQTISGSVTSHTGRMLVVVIKTANTAGTAPTVTSVTWAGVAASMYVTGLTSDNQHRYYIYYQAAPTTGTNNLVVTKSAASSANATNIVAYSFYNSDTTLRASAQNNGTGTTGSTTGIASTTNDYLVDIHLATAWTTAAAGSSQTADVSGGLLFIGHKQSTGTSVNLQATSGASGDWISAGI